MTALKADQVAAERLLNAAVRRAVEMYRTPGRMRLASVNRGTWGGNPTLATVTSLSYEWVRPDPAAVVAMLTAAAESADLLLTTAPAKKAATRRGAS